MSSPDVRGGTDAESLAAFFRERDVDVVPQGRFLWYASARGSYQFLPVHEEPDDIESRLRQLFRRPRVLAARFPTARPLAQGSTHNVVYVTEQRFEIERLSSNTRSKVRRGLKHCAVERVDPVSLAESGLALNASTAQRQGTPFGTAQVQQWQRLCRAAQGHPAFEAWAARVGDDLAALAVCYQLNDSYNIANVCSDATHLNSYPNNALLATILADVTARDDVTAVCYGLASLDRETEGLHHFKTSMGFEARPVHDNVVIRFGALASVARPIVNSLASRSSSHRLQQVSGALNHVQSRRSIRRSAPTMQPVHCPICRSERTFRLVRSGRRGLYRCRSCDVRFTSPQPTADELSEFYSNEYIPTADSMQLWFDRRRAGALDRTHEAVERHEREGRILDVGAAGGALLSRFDPASWKRTAVEPSQIAEAEQSDGIEFLWGLYPDAVPDGATFDVVTMLDVIMLMNDPVAALEACHRHLREDGLLAVEIPGNLFRLLLHVGPVPLVRGRGSTDLELTVHQFFFDDRSLRRLLNRTGFEVVDVEPLPASRVTNATVDRVLRAYSTVARAIPGVRRGRPGIGPKYLYLARRR